MLLSLFFSLLVSFATSLDLQESDVIDYLDGISDYLDEVGGANKGASRKFEPELNEPPETNSQIANLFNSNLAELLTTNEVQYLEKLANYTTRDTRLRSCHAPDVNLNFAMLRQRLKFLYLYFKSITPDGFSFNTGSPTYTAFTSKFKAITQDNKEVLVEWIGDAVLDMNLGYYQFTRIEMLKDCSQIPTEFPKEPQGSIEEFMDKLRGKLENDVFKTGQSHVMGNYQAFANEFLLSKVRVRMCETKNIVKREDFGAYLYRRYGQSNPKFSGLEFRTEKFSDYQTDAIFKMIVRYDDGGHFEEKFKFRISSLAEQLDGWLFWLADFVEVGCPIDLRKKPDPSDTTGKFIDDVCGSISSMVNEGEEVSTKWSFLDYMLKRKDGGFFAIIKGYNNGRISSFESFTEWLKMWIEGYKHSKLVKSEVVDLQNMNFKCIVQLQTNQGDFLEEEFKLKAYFETDKWLVKEVRVGFGAKKLLRRSL